MGQANGWLEATARYQQQHHATAAGSSRAGGQQQAHVVLTVTEGMVVMRSAVASDSPGSTMVRRMASPYEPESVESQPSVGGVGVVVRGWGQVRRR